MVSIHSQTCFHETMYNILTALFMVLTKENCPRSNTLLVIVNEFLHVVSVQLFNLGEEIDSAHCSNIAAG